MARDISADHVLDELLRAARVRFAGRFHERTTPEAIAKLKMLERLQPQIAAALRRVTLLYLEKHAAQAQAAADAARIQWTPERLRLLDKAIVETLDNRPVGKTALGVFRPMWPMTLAQLRAQIAALQPRENPTPKEKDARRYGPSGVYAVLARIPQDALPHARDLRSVDYRFIQSRMWAHAAPEGFPPYPRRGGVYSTDEAVAVHTWLRDDWPVVQEVRHLLRAKDRAFVLAGGNPAAAIHFATGNVGRGDDNAATKIFDTYERDWPYPSFAGMSPQELLTAVLTVWNDRLPYLDGTLALTPALFTRWPDPDAHMRALDENPVTRRHIKTVARYLYGVTGHHADWAKKLYYWARSPADLVAAHPDGKSTFPLSFVLERDLRDRAEYETDARTRQDLAAAELQALLPTFAALYRKGTWTRRAIERAIPGIQTEHRTIHAGHQAVDIVGPAKHWSVREYGSGVGDALEKLAKRLKLEQMA